MAQTSGSSSGTTSYTSTLPGPTKRGSLLVGCHTWASGTGSSVTTPTGWIAGPKAQFSTIISTQIFYMPYNPGNFTAQAWTCSAAVTIKGRIAEFTCLPGCSQAVDTTGTGATGTGATSLPNATSVSNLANDLCVVAYGAAYSATGSTWTTPTNYTAIGTIASLVLQYGFYYRAATPTGTQSVAGTVSTATNETGYADTMITFKEIPGPAGKGNYTQVPGHRASIW